MYDEEAIYQDADIERMDLEQAAREASHAARHATHEPTDEDVRYVYSAAFHAAYYFCPVFESVVQACLDRGISPDHELVQDAWFRATVEADRAE